MHGAVVTPLEIIAEWRRGCSCATNSPAECVACTEGMVSALENALQAEPKETFHLNRSRSVAVGNEKFIKDFTNCPRGVKLQLLNPGGVAVYGIYDGNPQWTGWYPVPGN